MRTHRLLLFALAVIGLSGCAQGVDRGTEAAGIVDASRWTIESFARGRTDEDQAFRANLETAQGVVIFPDATKLAFLIGVEGGNGVLLARNLDGSWGYPAFYTLGGPSFGLQAGASSTAMVLILRSRGAVDAVLNDQGKFGGEVQFNVGQFGAGFEAATTTNLGADVVGFSRGQGLFAGMSLEGSFIARRNDLNAAYYGANATPWTIVREARFTNSHADPLREALKVE